MKRIRLFFGAIALTFAFVSAFAFKSSAFVEDPAIVNASNECIRVQVECGGGNNTCQRVVNDELQDIHQFTSITSCEPLLKMP